MESLKRWICLVPIRTVQISYVCVVKEWCVLILKNSLSNLKKKECSLFS